MIVECKQVSNNKYFSKTNLIVPLRTEAIIFNRFISNQLIKQPCN